MKETKEAKPTTTEQKETAGLVNVERLVSKPKWWIEALTDKNKVHQGCLNCGGTEQVLEMDTRLYNGFGGWSITKNSELFFEEDCTSDKDWDEWKTLAEIEKTAKKEPDNDWRAIFNLPLRGGEYQRHFEEGWVLIESNRGFA